MTIFRVFTLTLVLLSFTQAIYAQSQSQLNEIALADLTEADKELNRLYKNIIKERSAEKTFILDLKEAQRAWLKYVDFHLKSIFPLDKGQNASEQYGSTYSMDFASEKAELFWQRVKQLKSL